MVCRVLKHTSTVHNHSVYKLQERLAEPERQEQQRRVDLEVFDSLQRRLHRLGGQAQMLNCVLNEQHLAQETLKSELLEQMETFKNVHDSWAGPGSDRAEARLADWRNRHRFRPTACQVKLAGTSIHSDLGVCVISGNVEFDMMKISAFSDGVVEQLEQHPTRVSNISWRPHHLSRRIAGRPSVDAERAQNEQQARYDIASATLKTFKQVLFDGELQRERHG